MCLMFPQALEEQTVNMVARGLISIVRFSEGIISERSHCKLFKKYTSKNAKHFTAVF
jgi:hypothetical protein